MTEPITGSPGEGVDPRRPVGPVHAVRVHWSDGHCHDDGIPGRDRAEALANAVWNWITATPYGPATLIEYRGRVGAVARDGDPPLTGIDSGVWHAVERIHLPRMAGDPDRGVAVCGRTVTVAVKFGPFDRERFPDRTCHACTWAVAIRAGTVGEEIARLTGEAPEPVLAARVAAAIVAAQAQPGADDEPDHPRTVALLAAVSAHAPTPLISPECGDGGCAHPRRVSCPAVVVVCLACSQRCGGWAGEWEGLCMPECTITAPCEVLRALAAHYRIACTTTGEVPDRPRLSGDRS